MFHPKQALTCSIKLQEIRARAFLARPDVKRKAAEGDSEFFSSGDIDRRQLEQEAYRYGFALNTHVDAETFELSYTITPLTPTQRAFSQVFAQGED